jgi:hypothetical protein
MGFYTNDDDVIKSLKDYSEGNTFSIFKLALESLYNARGLIEDSNFVINMFKNIGNNNDKDAFINFILDKNIYLNQEYTETNLEDLQKFNDYWKNGITQPAPLLFFIIPHLNDEQLEKVFSDGMLGDIPYNENSKVWAENLIIKFFESNQYKSLIALKEHRSGFINQASFYDTKIYPGQTEEKYLGDLISEFIENQPILLIAYDKFQSYSFVDKSEQWFTNQLDKERRNHILIQEFFDNVFEHLPQNGKELITARTLYRTNNLDYTMVALNKMGITDISDYKPTEYPLWLYAANHENKSIYRKLLRSGVSIFDHYPASNKTFFTIILDGPSYKENLAEILEEQKIDQKDFIRELLQKKIDDDGVEYCNYSLVSGSQDTRTLKSIDLKLSDLVFYKKKFAAEKFESLPIKEQLNLLNDVIDRTMLAPTYMLNKGSNRYARESLEKKVINFNLFAYNLSHYDKFGEIVEKHLDLLEQVEPAVCDYRQKYFKVVLQMFDRYDSGYISKANYLYKIFSKIIDYTATDKNLDWQALNKILSNDSLIEKKPNFVEGSIDIYNYLSKVCLSHELKTSSSPDKKKLKI